jgi:hypothetical protein
MPDRSAPAFAGLSAGDEIDLKFLSFAAGDHAVWRQTSGNEGTISLVAANGSLLATLVVEGTWNSQDFTVTDDGGGTVVTVAGLLHAPAPDDFTAARGSDVPWRNSNGTLAEWFMNGSAIASSGSPTSGGSVVSPDASWSMAGSGDFNGDGDADLLWRNSNGTLAEWFMNGSTITSGASPTFGGSPVSPDSTWNVTGIGDLNGDGDADMLWRNNNGALVEWLMNGSTISASASPTFGGSPVSPDSTWNVAGIGDFNDDGKPDVLWRNSNGALALWQMNGSSISTSASPTSSGSTVSPDASWSVAGIGDFNGDGKADILWRQGTTGSLAMWMMNGSAIASSASVTYQGTAITPDSTWNIVEVGDFNGGSDSEILWRQSTTGVLAEWQMNGAQVVSSQEVTSLGAPVTPNSTWQTLAKPTDFA